MNGLQEQIEHLVEVGALGRSERYSKLLRFLGQRAIEGTPPTEMEIAIEVFSKSKDYNPSVDNVVRVYAHHLRRKLDKYYSNPKVTDEPILSLPLGAYRLEVKQPKQATTGTADNIPAPAPQRQSTINSFDFRKYAAPVLSAVVGGLAVFFLSPNVSVQQNYSVANRQLNSIPEFWHSFLSDDRDVLIVYGDLATYSVWDKNTKRKLKVRSSIINSVEDFEKYSVITEEQIPKWEDRTILTKATAQTLHRVSETLSPFKSTRAMPSSELQPEDIHSNHVIYLGNLKALRLLDTYFNGSNFELTNRNRRIKIKESGEILHVNREGSPKQDFALLAKYDGPSGNQIAILGGTVAEGILAAGKITTEQKHYDALKFPNASKANFEFLVEAFGLEQSSYTSHRIISNHNLASEKIWSSECNTDCLALIDPENREQ